MKIAIAVSQYHRSGGFPRAATQLATGLDALGHDVTVITQRAEIKDADAGISFEWYRIIDWSDITSMITEPFVVSRLLRNAVPRFDVIVAIGMPVMAPVVLQGPGTHTHVFRAAISAKGVPPLYKLVDRFRPFHRIVNFWERKMLKGHHPLLVVVPNSRAIGEYTQESFHFPAERVAVIPYGVEMQEFTFSSEVREKVRGELGVDDETMVILNISNRRRQKGVDVILDVAKKISSSVPTRFVFAGIGSEQAGFARAAADLVASSKVSVLGRVPSTRDLYCAADLLLHPSRADPWGLVVTEAISCGLVVACSAGIGAARAIVPGENGLFIDDPTNADEIVRILDDALPTIRQFDRELVRQSVSWLSHIEVAKMYVDEFEKLLAK